MNKTKPRLLEPRLFAVLADDIGHGIRITLDETSREAAQAEEGAL